MRIIAGKYKNLHLKTPKGMTTRPTSSRMREAIFNILQHEIEGARFLDLFAGSGAMGLEALSRGAASAAFIDDSRDSARIIQENIKHLGVQSQTTLLYGDCLAQLPRLAKLESPYTIIYADPPYTTDNLSLGRMIVEAVDKSSILQEEGFFFLEDADIFEKIMPQLETLVFLNARSVGRSTLFEFQKKSTKQK